MSRITMTHTIFRMFQCIHRPSLKVFKRSVSNAPTTRICSHNEACRQLKAFRPRLDAHAATCQGISGHDHGDTKCVQRHAHVRTLSVQGHVHVHTLSVFLGIPRASSVMSKSSTAKATSSGPCICIEQKLKTAQEHFLPVPPSDAYKDTQVGLHARDSLEWATANLLTLEEKSSGMGPNLLQYRFKKYAHCGLRCSRNSPISKSLDSHTVAELRWQVEMYTAGIAMQAETKQQKL